VADYCILHTPVKLPDDNCKSDGNLLVISNCDETYFIHMHLLILIHKSN
jgi:hypothetical protein